MLIRSIMAATVLLACQGVSAQSMLAISLDSDSIICDDAEALEVSDGMTLHILCEDTSCDDSETAIFLEGAAIATNLGCDSSSGF